MRKLMLLISLLLIGTLSMAQSMRTYERAGDKAYKNKDYNAALQYYAKILQKRQENMGVWWKYGESTRQFLAFSEAEKAYRRVLGLRKDPDDYPLLQLRLGEVRKAQGDYAGAKTFFETFLQENHEKQAEAVQRAQREVLDCQWAIDQLAKDSKVEITHPGKEINSPFSDFAPVTFGDTLFFSSYRFDNKYDKKRPRSKLTKVMYATGKGRAREPSRNFPAVDTAHVAHTAFTVDRNFVIFTQCHNINPNEIRCELWHSFRDRRGRWAKPKKLPEPMNLPGYTSTQPHIGYEGEKKIPYLWFVSDRPGGKGGLDLWVTPLDTIWYCPCTLLEGEKKMNHNPRFVPPQNLESLNTAGNEATPFFHGESGALWFSSDAYTGFGGYDIFTSKKDKNGYSTPKNAGPGLNTSYNDVYLTLRPDGKTGYLSSNRTGSFYLDETNKACCNDIFAFKLPEEPPVKPAKDTLAPLSVAPITPAPAAMANPVPLPPLLKLQDFVGLTLYFDNDEPDKRTRKTTTRKDYEETVLAYLEREAEYRQQFADGLNSDARQTAEDAVENFFENEVRRGYDRLGQLADLIYTRLQDGQKIEIVIKGFTSPRAQTDYNLNLGKRRISSVRNYFAAYNDGVLENYIQKGQLIVSETSFGETTARLGISDRLEDERNSVYNPEAARERRVEIVEIK